MLRTVLRTITAVLAAAALGVPACAVACPVPCTVALDGTWRFMPGLLRGNQQFDPQRRDDESRWASIRVPANWYLEGFDISGVGWYRRSVDVPRLPPGSQVRLEFNGADYFTDAWVNGVHVGSHEGYFDTFGFDITKSLRPGQRNEIVVRVDSPIEHPSDWSQRKRLIKGIFSHHDTRPGGAWSTRGQERNTGGLWNSVRLRISGDLAIGEPRIHTVGIDAAAPAVQVQVPLLGTGRAARVEIRFDPKNFQGRSHVLQQEVSAADIARGFVRFEALLPGARLWWPADLGAPHLYRVSARLWRGARLLDEGETSTGLRRVEVDEGKAVTRINGQRLFVRGTNYIPTQWLSEMTPAAYRRDLALMRAAHVNAVRVHAHVGARDFYRAADEAGLLVWQDFPLQWGYQDTAVFRDEAVRQAQAMVRLLDNHPSIYAWSLHNEPPWDAWWMKFKYPDYDPAQNKVLDERLYRVVRSADPLRYVHQISATAEHQWMGWYSGHWTDFNRPTTHSLVTEFGAQALPGIQSLRRMFNDDQIWPDNDRKFHLWEYHNFQRDETFKNAKVVQGKNIHEFVANSQRYQARLVQLAAESLRRQKYQPVGAIFQFMFVENWPSITWAVLDYWRQPKAGYHAMARAYQPLLPSIQWSVEQPPAGSVQRLGLVLVNDLPRVHDQLTLQWRLRCDHLELASGTRDAAVAADAVATIGEIVTPPLPAGSCVLSVLLRDAAGSDIASNEYEFDVK